MACRAPRSSSLIPVPLGAVPEWNPKGRPAPTRHVVKYDTVVYPAMLGELLIEDRGKVSGTRVLPDGKVESTDQSSGKVLGIEETSVSTWWGAPRPDGTWWGEGQGISTTKEGDAITFRGQGVGRPTGRGSGQTWRGAVFFQTASPKLARLNGVAGIYEVEIDETGNSHSKIWEWK